MKKLNTGWEIANQIRRMIVSIPKEPVDPSVRRPILSEMVRIGIRPLLIRSTYNAT